ncbi:DUF3935 domain-containing protein [Bacillus cytotoxicus]|uniref:DUF3935 domain-containing protein n=1 Tax=Bacillus cytotoxicus (strain DSM 22905 / CIP 110041 / 391-98 / NVH 391-98) TaxID=315749 RepID=A7GV73_BACCN|nr:MULTISPECIES: DUF3935 domain-containing protein [Bacillus cereus group]ABS24031.1 conserved hypothetical protein [Bacillus cytotoxicus NVH 391-98]AWC34663.1 DUF3935 domain-containing protein [Bacillus cytotoxicus]AWC38656.1 DUF3935 domain-containing protein [Bacillus cytotoxicus]AWC46632.1 DUF3935 domain-containing protein [Bacillus cytotoxicus]AWC62876.1 DUF3935 domain-containing protein [Bacillus cytotoxicus]
MTRVKQIFGIMISFFVFWFSMLGVQMFAEFLDIDSFKFIVGKTETARAFYSPYPFLIVFLLTLLSLYFFVIKLGKPKKANNILPEENKEQI